MSNESTYEVRSARNDMILVYDTLVGAGALAMTLPNAGKFTAFIASVVRTGAGTFTLKFKKKYPVLKFAAAEPIGTTAGLQARFSAIDVVAGTATLVTEVAGAATDPAATDLVHIHLAVRNSGRNK